MSEGNGIVSSATLKARERERVVDCPSGFRYRIRRLASREYIAAIGTLPQVGAMPETDAEAKQMAERVGRRLGGDLVAMIRTAEALVSAALAEPRIGAGEGEIALDDIPPEDLYALGAAVTDLYGINRAKAAQLRPTSASEPS